MDVVAIESQKGGTGKTTTAIHLAVAAEKSGKAVVVIDLDPQASAAGWKDSRGEDEPVVVATPASRITQAIQAARVGGADLIIIDTAPHSGDVALAAAEVADMILIPCRPGILDLRAIGNTARAVKLAGKPGYVILNAVPPNSPRSVADAREAAAVHGLPVAPVVLHQRAAFAHALTIGKTAQEYEPEGKAADEITQLFNWVIGALDSSQASLLATRQHGNTATRQHGNKG